VRLKNSVVLITGASSGIGEATALAFAKKGARLALCARRLGRLQAVAKRCREAGSPKVTTKRVDVTSRAEARGFVAAALRDFERIDILVNNAGLGWAGPLVEMPEDSARALVETNLLGVVWTTQAALESMLTARSGVVINVSSIAGVRATPYSALYSATKHAVTGLSHALRGELSGTGVKVCAVYPAVTKSEFFAVSGGREVGPVYPAAWVANLIVRTARFPRRDAMVFPFRIAHLAEPFLGGLIDHVVGEVRRKAEPDLSR
jgi:NADP-dependent 3-hydroxy acid dehydrogenase YdfG